MRVIRRLWVALTALHKNMGILRDARDAEFLDRLNTIGFRTISGEKPGCGANVVFAELLCEEYDVEDTEAYSRFDAQIRQAFERARDWLLAHDVRLFQSFVASGLELEILISAWIDSDQIDLEFEADFLKACGERGIRLNIMSNE